MLRFYVLLVASFGLCVDCARAVDVPVPSSGAFASGASGDGKGHAVPSDDLWAAFLADRVDEAGLVDYRGARSDGRLREYLYRLAHADLAGLGGSATRKAFWINTYNALAIQGVLETLGDEPDAGQHYRVIDQPIDGLKASKGFFQGLRFAVGGQRFTLDEIEKRILLRQWEGLGEDDVAKYGKLAPGAGDPRVHFALVCCARGCPKLQRFAYDGAEIDAQLDAAARAFLADTSQSRFDATALVWHASELFNWYEADFSNADYSPSAPDLFKFAARYVDKGAVRSSLLRDRWRLKFIKYDWRLNIRE